MNRSVTIGWACTAFVGGAVFAAGCAKALPGTYLGDAVEAGTLEITVPETGQKATNERPATTIPKQTVTVETQGEAVVVRFGGCDLKGKPSGPERVVVTGECNVKFAGYDDRMPLSGTATLENGALTLDLTGLRRNTNTIASYSYTYKGSRKD
jgi:hypothetical protein